MLASGFCIKEDYNRQMGTVALITDFGTHDWFVGTMKGVIYTINPSALIVDISHHIAQGDIRAAAFCLLSSYRSFPKNSVFIVVVDPGVGSDRKGIVAKKSDYLFVGPDNGILSFVLADRSNHAKVFEIEKDRYYRKPVSNTFHGRDIFSPVGAHLSKGLSPSHVGRKLNKWVSLHLPEVEISKEGVLGEILYIDRFGNAFTNITAETLRQYDNESCFVFIKDRKPIPLCKYYSQVKNKEALALINSAGHLEIAINNGNAAQFLDLSVGSEVRIWPG